MINKGLAARHFDVMSRSYEEHARVQKNMAATLQQQGKAAGNFTNILEIGCGTGYLTRLIAELYPQASILATDIAPGMLRTAKANLADCQNVSYALEDGENLQTTETFDLIISNAAFQWFNDQTKAYEGFLTRLRPGGCLLYATFGPETFRELHASFHIARQALHLQESTRHGQEFAPVATLESLMTGLGYENTVHREEYVREYFPSVKEYLASVKKIGANNAGHQGSIAVNRRLMFSMMRCYEEIFRENSQIYATYHVIYGFGRKKGLRGLNNLTAEPQRTQRVKYTHCRGLREA